MKSEDIKQAMTILYEDARVERQQLRKEFNNKDYMWYVSSEIFTHLQQMIYNYNVLHINEMYAFDIKVTCCPYIKGVELVHRIGGIEL